MGYPDFLFTILAYSMLLLVFCALMWVTFGVLAYLTENPVKAELLVRMMDSMQTGLLALALVVIGLAASYTVRRLHKDKHYLEKKKLERALLPPRPAGEDSNPVQDGLTLVYDAEDV
jgi:hypothetical protein